MNTITMDTVRDLIERHSDHISGNTREFYNGAYAEIADELNSRADYHGYEQAAIEAWESIKAWNTRAELGSGTCENIAPDYLDFLCSKCGFVHYHSDENDTGDGNDWNYCPNCGARVMGE